MAKNPQICVGLCGVFVLKHRSIYFLAQGNRGVDQQAPPPPSATGLDCCDQVVIYVPLRLARSTHHQRVVVVWVSFWAGLLLVLFVSLGGWPIVFFFFFLQPCSRPPRIRTEQDSTLESSSLAAPALSLSCSLSPLAWLVAVFPRLAIGGTVSGGGGGGGAEFRAEVRCAGRKD